LIGKDLKINETTAVAMQQYSKHSSTNNRVTVGKGVFYVDHAEELS
jgi:hypothetical protein